jgi:hypothetical protein
MVLEKTDIFLFRLRVKPKNKPANPPRKQAMAFGQKSPPGAKPVAKSIV